MVLMFHKSSVHDVEIDLHGNKQKHRIKSKLVFIIFRSLTLESLLAFQTLYMFAYNGQNLTPYYNTLLI